MPQVYIGLGSNLGARTANLERARRELRERKGIEVLGESPVEETDPVDLVGQPRFLNQVVLVRTVMEPLELLRILKGIERKMGRKPSIPKGPRVIDLDILLYGDRVMDTEYLRIPHPRIRERDFVMKHLIALDPDIADPVDRKKYREVFHAHDQEHQ